MKKGFLAALMACMMITSLLTACGSLKKDEAKTVKLDPDNPVTLKVWHYYNGHLTNCQRNLIQPLEKNKEFMLKAMDTDQLQILIRH